MVLFNGDECKFIAEFYATNYKTLSSSGSGTQINARRNNLIKKLTNEINSRRPTSRVTEVQVRQKIQDLKRGTKSKNGHNNRVKRPTGGGKDESLRLSAAEEILVAKLGNTAAFCGVPGGGLESESINPLEESQSEQSDLEDTNDQEGQLFTQSQQRSQQQIQQQRRPLLSFESRQTRPCLISTPQCSILTPQLPSTPQVALDEAPGLSWRKPSNVADARTIRSRRANRMDELEEDKKEVFKLQKETLELQNKSTLQQLKATEEFRCFVLEKRMILRGANLTDAPLNVEEDLYAHQASLLPQNINDDDDDLLV